MGSYGRKQMLRFSARLTEAKSVLIVILWDISGHRVWKNAVFKIKSLTPHLKLLYFLADITNPSLLTCHKETFNHEIEQ